MSDGSWEITPEELECVELIARRLIPPRVFRMLGQIPSNRRKREKVWEGHTVPKGIHILCDKCNEASTMEFEPFTQDLQFNVVTGMLTCGYCDNSWKVWLMEPGEMRDTGMSRWKEIWISPPLRDEEVELPPEVDDEDFRDVFKEAALTLETSPRASAMLSRYCLQKLLREKAKVKEHNLHQEIDKAAKDLPSYLSENLYTIKEIGNCASHPDDEIPKIEKYQAEWVLKVLRQLFDFYLVEPARSQEMRSIFQKKKSTDKEPKNKDARR